MGSGVQAAVMPQCFSRLRPGETEEEEQGQEEGSRGGKGFMVERIRARQSATSLLGAQARAGVWPGQQQKHRQTRYTRKLLSMAYARGGEKGLSK